MTAIRTRKFQQEVPFSQLKRGPVRLDIPDDHPAIDQVTFKRTFTIGGYIGYTMPTEFVECTVRLTPEHWEDVTFRATDAKWREAVEEAVRLYELLDGEEPETCNLDAIRAEWQAYKDSAEPYTDAIVIEAHCKDESIEFIRHFLAYIDRPLEMTTDLEEALGLFSQLDSEPERDRLKKFIDRIYRES